MRPPEARDRPGTPITRSSLGPHVALLCRSAPAGRPPDAFAGPTFDFWAAASNHRGSAPKIDPGRSCGLLGHSWWLLGAAARSWGRPSAPVVATGRHWSLPSAPGRRPTAADVTVCNKVVVTVARRAPPSAPGAGESASSHAASSRRPAPSFAFSSRRRRHSPSRRAGAAWYPRTEDGRSRRRLHPTSRRAGAARVPHVRRPPARLPRLGLHGAPDGAPGGAPAPPAPHPAASSAPGGAPGGTAPPAAQRLSADTHERRGRPPRSSAGGLLFFMWRAFLGPTTTHFRPHDATFCFAPARRLAFFVLPS